MLMWCHLCDCEFVFLECIGDLVSVVFLCFLEGDYVIRLNEIKDVDVLDEWWGFFPESKENQCTRARVKGCSEVADGISHILPDWDYDPCIAWLLRVYHDLGLGQSLGI